MTKPLALASSQISRSRLSSKSNSTTCAEPGTTPRDGRRVCAKGSRRTTVSQSHVLTQPGCKVVDRAEVIGFQLRIIIQDLLFCHAGGQPIQHIPHCYTQSSDTRLARAFARLDRDAGTHPSRISLAFRE